MGDYIRHRELPAGKEESMMDDMKRALLGDHEAAKRLTDAGVLLPCMCGGDAKEITWRDEYRRINPTVIRCKKCGIETPVYNRIKDARLAWNTRAPILSAEEINDV